MTSPGHALSSLRVRRSFLAAAKADKEVRRGLIVQARARNIDEPSTTPVRYGLTTSKKIGNAVARNRARRRLRALAQEILPLEGQAGFDYVMIGRVHTALRPWNKLKSDLRSALKVMHKNAPENEENALGYDR